MTTYSLGIDVGGTFTDLVCADEAGRTQTEKVLTTLESQDIGVLSGVNKLATKYGLAEQDFHTVAEAEQENWAAVMLQKGENL